METPLPLPDVSTGRTARSRRDASSLRCPVFLACFLGGFLWSLAYLLLSSGWSLDDELSHYLRSRSVGENPVLIFDAWTRIGRNLFHVIPAAFGLTAARLWTLLFAAGAVLLTARLAVRMGVRRAWLIPLLLWFQPWFVELAWGVLTQTPFLIALLGGIWFLAERRLAWSGLCFGLLPLIRHEGIALLALWATVIVAERLLARRPADILLAALASAAPLAAYNLAAWWWTGDVPARLYFDAKPTEMYGSGPLWHFITLCLVPAGPFTVALAAVGTPRSLRLWRTTWPLVFYPAYFALHSLIFWKGLFASGGYYHFLMPAAPGLAIVAAFGADNLLGRPARWAVRIAGIALAGAVIQGIALPHILFMQQWAGLPYHLGLAPDPLARALDEAMKWQNIHRPRASPVVCRHVYAAFASDWIETADRRALASVPPDDLPAGAVLIWESKYSDLNGAALSALTAPDAPWREIAVFGGGAVRVFEKIR